MIKTIATAVILMRMVALGIAQEIRPQLIVVGTTPTTVTLELQAGSDPILNGFEVSFQKPYGLKRSLFVSEDAPNCGQFALQPGQISEAFTIDGVTNDDCISYNQTQAITCATGYRFFARAGNIISTGVTTLTQQCP